MPTRAVPFIARMAGTGTFLSSFMSPPGPRRQVLSAGALSTTSWSRSVYSGSKRHVVLRSLLRISNLLDELIEMRRRVHEVDLIGIDDQQRRLVVPVEVVRVRLAELLQIL